MADLEEDEALKAKIRRQTVEYIRDLSQRMRSMDAAKKELIEQLQADCPHPMIYRSPFKEGILIDHKPVLVCGTCKLQEDEWGVGGTLKYVKNASVVEVSSDQLWIIRDTW